MAGTKHDEGKPRLALVTSTIIIEIARAMTHGAVEYGEHNWREGIAYSRLYSAMMGHILAWWSGEEIDSESKLPHLSLAASELMMLMDMPKEFDDRFCRKLEGKVFKNRMLTDCPKAGYHHIPLWPVQEKK